MFETEVYVCTKYKFMRSEITRFELFFERTEFPRIAYNLETRSSYSDND